MLWILLVLAFVKGLLWSISLPPWYGPDETAHFEYVQYLATNHRPPLAGDSTDWSRSLPYEVNCSSHNLGFRSNREFNAEPPWGRDPTPCPQRFDAAARIPASSISAAGDYSPLYYLIGLPFWEAASAAPVEVRLHAVRLLSVLLGVLATLFAYLAALRVFGGRVWAAEASAAVFLLNPIESQATAAVNNDALLLMLAAAAVWRLLAATAGSLGVRQGLCLGAIIGAAFWAKPQGAFLAAGIPAVVLLLRVRGHPWSPALRWAVAAAGLVAVLVVAELATAGALRGQLTPHGLLEKPTGPHGLSQWLAIYSSRSWNHLYFLFVSSAWGGFSYYSATLPASVLIGVLIAYGLAAGGLVVTALRRDRRSLRLGMAAFLTVTQIGLILALELAYFRSQGVLILQGRSFLEAWPAAAIVLVAGLLGVVPRRWEPTAAGLVALCALAVNSYSLMVLWDTFFG